MNGLDTDTEEQKALRIFPNPLQHLIWIERIAEAVADVVDGDDAEEDHQAREDRQPGIFDEVVLCSWDKIASGGSRLLDAETEETQARLLNDGVTELQCRFDDDDSDAVGQDVPDDDAAIWGAEGTRGRDVIQFTQSEERGAHEARESHPRKDADHKGNRENIIALKERNVHFAQDCREQNEDEKWWEW